MSSATCIYTERAEAERGIERLDGLLREAQRDGSPLAPYMTLYTQQRRAYARTAAAHDARIKRMEAAHG
jgi:hypothetical protein